MKQNNSINFKGIDLSSDTATKPTLDMKKAMMEAELGDEQKNEDPTTRKLEDITAELLGLDNAMFLPSATMANEIAIRLLCEPGDELIAAEKCHLFFSEGGGPAIHSGVITRSIYTKTGIFTGEDIRSTYRWAKGPHYPVPKCVSIENTTNLGGGLAWDLNTINSVLSVAKELNLKTHLDGSRLFNAAIKMQTEPNLIASNFDTVTLCLSKGLGCPMGALLVFKSNCYEKARRLKQLWGGAMRQSGIVAAAGIYALQNNIKRLIEDHENAQLLSERIDKEIDEIEIEKNPSSTNMVFFKWLGKNMTAPQFIETCIKKGLRFSQVEENRFRAVSHLDIKRTDIDRAINVLKEVIKNENVVRI